MQARLTYPVYTCPKCVENLEQDGITPVCKTGTCPIPDISAGNHLAKRVYDAINSQFIYDFHLAGLVVESIAVEYSTDDWLTLWAKLSTIHEVIKNHGKQSGQDNTRSR